MVGKRTIRGTAKVAGLALVAAGALVAGPGGLPTASAQPLACTPIGKVTGTISEFTLYDLANYAGSCVTFYRYGACTSSTGDVEDLENLAQYGWDNRADSVHTYGTCNVQFYDLPDCPAGGAHTGFIEEYPDLHTWSNRASCLIVS